MRIVSNGGAANETLLSLTLTGSEWRKTLLASFPGATRITLWSRVGEALLWAAADGSGSNSPRVLEKALTKALAEGGILFAVVNDYPFFWPKEEVGSSRSVAVAGGRTVMLRTQSQMPRESSQHSRSYRDGLLMASAKVLDQTAAMY